MSWASIHREERDGRPVYVKRTTYDARLEGGGLLALALAGAPVPQVIFVDRQVLVIEEVTGSPDWAKLGRSLAQVHRCTEDRYGFDYDNVIGSLRQDNTWTPSWNEFFVANRIRPWLGALPTSTRRRIEDAIAGPMTELLEHGQTPSLLHGDLWSGNVVDGSYLIDPAVSYGDRELDLAFSTVFGGIPAEFHAGYHEAWPLDAGYKLRKTLYNLYHILNHYNMFGGGYGSQAEGMLDKLLAEI